MIDSNNVIVCGHTRYKAAKKIGLKSVPCIIADDLTEEQIKAFRLADNKTAEFAEWDFDLLSDEIGGIFDIDMSDFGFSLGIECDEQKEIVEDEPPEIDEDCETMCKSGDIWQLGEHRLMCGNSTDREQVERLMNGEKADICLTSPPYGMARTAHLRKHLEKGVTGRDGKSFYGEGKDNSAEWDNLLSEFFKIAKNITHSQFINIMLVADNKRQLIKFLNDNSNNLVDIIVWNKHTCPPQIQKNVLNNGYEFVFIFDSENNTRTIRYGNFKGNKSNYIETKKEQNQYADIHKAVFSVEFAATILNINELAKTVYEPFGGTGTTLIACEQLDRKCYMMELSEKYCDVIIQKGGKN